MTTKWKAIKDSWQFSRWGARHIEETQLKGKLWFYAISPNNIRSLEFLEKAYPEAVYVSSPTYFNTLGKTIVGFGSPYRFFYWLWHLPFSLYLFISRKDLHHCLDMTLRASGLYESYLSALRKHRPTAIVFSNDHTLEPRALLLAAETLGIPTVYIQHACVRRDFPPLRFSLSLLEGQDSVDKYSLVTKPRGKISLIGLPRMDAWIKTKNTAEKVTRLGICSNLLDPIERLELVIKTLSVQFPNLAITYRPHPSDKRVLRFAAANVSVSDSKTESAMVFLQRHDAVIAGNTSIHYEALSLNMASVYFRFDDDKNAVDDMYDFVKQGLVPAPNTPDELVAYIAQLELAKPADLTQKAQYYNATLGTKDEGHSEALALRAIKETIVL